MSSESIRQSVKKSSTASGNIQQDSRVYEKTLAKHGIAGVLALRPIRQSYAESGFRDAHWQFGPFEANRC